MKLQIKLSNNKCLVIEIDESRTVRELKEKLSQHLDLPRNIVISYEGKILEDTEQLSAYNIDERKILTTIIPKKRPNEAAASALETQNDESNDERVTPDNAASVDRMMKELAKCESAGEATRNGELIERIVAMGFDEEEVRRALAECSYNPKRAVEYILDNTPITPSSVESQYYSDTDDDTPLSFQRMTEEDPSMLEIIDDDPENFLDYFQNYEFEGEGEGEGEVEAELSNINFEPIEDEQDDKDKEDKVDNDKDKDKQNDKKEGDEVKNDNIEGVRIV
ncbi:hypothetical protein DOY81_007322 [Sarcophaga bullata]|nr:hypothetical protein DOY81_007322 [Sarcophaga bullata]